MYAVGHPGDGNRKRWEITQAARVVRSKPGMLDAPVQTAGATFTSGSQRQRLTIAALALMAAKVAILDDRVKIPARWTFTTDAQRCAEPSKNERRWRRSLSSPAYALTSVATR